MSERDTIAAIATAPGRGGIGVVRISGRRLAALASAIAGKSPSPRRATLSTFRNASGEAIDQGLALYFPAPHSYTGDDVLELHGHGGPVVLRLLLERCLQLGARLAEPGEFTRRAFLNGKLDLVEAEGVVDLIDAATADAARCALRSLRGEFSARVADLVSAVTELRTLVEGTLDFPEEDIDFLERHGAGARLTALRSALRGVLGAAKQGSLLREGLHVVLAGQPNVGKSTLLNRLAGEELAIVSEIAGTTRDTIRQSIDIDGIPLHVIDTAGLRDSEDPIERIGVERAWQAIARADAVMLLVDARNPMDPDSAAILARLPTDVPRLTVHNKVDLAEIPAHVVRSPGGPEVWVSAKTGAGVQGLRDALLELAGWERHPESAFLARERHLEALRAAEGHLAQAEHEVGRLELLAEELRLAQEQLSTITGEFTSDDLLGEIFSRFCIGK
jgi:tRNA modification GTPase